MREPLACRGLHVGPSKSGFASGGMWDTKSRRENRVWWSCAFKTNLMHFSGVVLLCMGARTRIGVVENGEGWVGSVAINASCACEERERARVKRERERKKKERERERERTDPTWRASG